MPKSKRDKKVSLTKTSKKGVQLKQQIIENVKTCVESYKHIVLFTFHNMRNIKLKEIRETWKGSKFFFGKNKIIALAMGKLPETEIVDGLSKLASRLQGQCALLFTNEKRTQVLEWMNSYEELDYARSGFIAPVTIELPAGPLSEFSHSIEPHLRQLGMPTSLQKGIVTLLKDFTVCEEGQVLTPEQCRILKLLEKPLATFRFIPIGIFSRKHGYKPLSSKDSTVPMEEDRENND